MIELEIVGVRVEMPSNQPLVLLKEVAGDRHLPIWIGTAEATAIALAQQGVVPPRPLTHDLLCSIVKALGRSVASVTLTAVEDGVFYAQLMFDDGTAVGSRASDALAVALRADCTIWCAPAVMEDAGVRITDHDEEEPDAITSPEAEERELRRFREFLNGVEPEDFEK
ncbi:MAG: bifunctional nuclease family protein [Actinomycetota bacterium]|uniref:bifunctional nuclease family protein n=1 Tax=Micrococcaceae TaxID=1268 RepID=UPI0024BB1A1E|nr:bifunctional nuclease family protein [Paenarthrobacter sp. PH39-S1]MDJ0356969.1 bifunctional nuclease family protein [Paenarthrobacter sp. PH39-S1]MDQ6739520.1 bifunctional nuclease family protein [Actinomycetota bacterium]